MSVTLSRRALSLLTVPYLRNLTYRSSSIDAKKEHNILTNDIACPGWVAENIVGKKGKYISALLKKYPGTAILHSDKANMVQVRCSDKDLKAATTDISNHVKYMIETHSQVLLKIDHNIYDAVVGKERNLINIASTANVHITIYPKDKDQHFKITGLKDRVEQVKEQVLKRAATMTSTDLEIKRCFHFFLRGKGREIANNIKHTYPEVFVKFPKERDCNKVLLSGPPEDVEQVSNLIKKYVQEADLVDVELEIEKKYYGFILASDGKNMKKLQHTFPNVSITFPDKESSSNKILLCGSREDVEQVSNVIKELIVSEDIIDVKLEIEKKYHGFLLGYQGQRIKKIRLGYPQVHVIFPSRLDNEEPCNIVSITGPREQVEQVCDILKDITEVELEVKKEFCEFLSAFMRKKIKHNYPEVQIIISIESNKVSIWGPHKSVMKLKEELSDDNIYEEAVALDPKLYGLIIGPNGDNVNTLMKEFEYVNVDFSDQSGEIVIKGKKTDVMNMKDGLMSFVQGLTHCVQIRVEPFVYNFLNCEDGIRISKLRQEFGVSCYIPPTHTTGEDTIIIKITGRLERVDKAVENLKQQIKQADNYEPQTSEAESRNS